MPNRYLKFLIVLLLAAAVTACGPTEERATPPPPEIESAVEQIATAIVIDPAAPGSENTPTPLSLVPETGNTDLSAQVETAVPTPTETRTSAPTDTVPPIATATLPATATPTATITRTLTSTFTPTFAPTRTPTRAVPGTGFITLPAPTDTPAATPRIPRLVTGVPPELEEAGNWPMMNRDYTNARQALGSTISAINASSFGIAWSHNLPRVSPTFAPAGSPIIVSQFVYYQDMQGSLYAFRLSTGELLWKRDFDQSVGGASGPAAGYGKLYAHVGSELRAFDLLTGEDIWALDLDESGNPAQPVVYGGLVLTSTRQIVEDAVNGATLVTGYFYAVDHETGEIAWQLPASSALAGSQELSGGAWFPPAVDEESGIAYWGVGRLVESQEGQGGEAPVGSIDLDPYEHAVAAVDLDQGSLLWVTSLETTTFAGHGLEVSPLLVTLENEGEEPRNLVIGGGRGGRLIALEPETGEVLWETRAGRQQNVQAEQMLAATAGLYPGLYGGVASPMAYADGILYAVVNHLPPNVTPPSEQPVIPTTTPSVGGTPAAAPLPQEILMQGSAELVAVDASNGRLLWTLVLKHMSFGGVTVVNDLLIISTIDGFVYAYDRDTGRQIWSAQGPVGLITLPAVSGEYLVMAALGGDRPFLFTLRLGLTSTVVQTPASPATPTAVPTLPGVQPVLPTATQVVPQPTSTQPPAPAPVEPTLTPAPTEP